MRGHRMPEADALEFFGAPRVRGSERIRSLDMSTGPGRPSRSCLGASEHGRMLLSFERPACRRRSEDLGPRTAVGTSPLRGP
jgi:hypothetical protein